VTSTLRMTHPRPVELLPPTLQTIPEAVEKNIAIARARTRSRIMAVVKADKSLDPSISLSPRETWVCRRKVRTGERRSIRGFTHRGIEVRLKLDTSSPSGRIGEDSSDAVRVAGGAR
jgi:hypothetical protein